MVAALSLTHLAASMLFQMEPADPPKFGITMAVLLATAAATGFLPARRASLFDPMSVLRAS